MREAIQKSSVPRIAVSPIVGGAALKGPAAKMFGELGIEPSALAVARMYSGLIDGFVLDQADEELVDPIRSLGAAVLVTDSVMTSLDTRARLAREIVKWGTQLRGR